MSPTYDEIRKHFKFSSYNSVFKHLKQLEEKGFIANEIHRKRAITLVERGTPGIPTKLLGNVAAGKPIEAIEVVETISIPPELLGNGENFCLRVKGDSMIEDGIHDGDIVIIDKKSTANNNTIVVALINNEATLKRFFKRKNYIELKPANSLMKSIKIKSGDFRILGVLVALLRKY